MSIQRTQKRAIQRRVIDKIATLGAFKERISKLSEDELSQELNLEKDENFWLSTYDVWDTYADIPEGPVSESNAFILLKILKDMNFNIKGVTTEHQSKNISIPRPTGEKIIYVGKLNTFNNKAAHPTLSILISDKRYVNNSND